MGLKRRWQALIRSSPKLPFPRNAGVGMRLAPAGLMDRQGGSRAGRAGTIPSPRSRAWLPFPLIPLGLLSLSPLSPACSGERLGRAGAGLSSAGWAGEPGPGSCDSLGVKSWGWASLGVQTGIEGGLALGETGSRAGMGTGWSESSGDEGWGQCEVEALGMRDGDGVG